MSKDDKLPSVTGREVVAALEAAGFEWLSESGAATISCVIRMAGQRSCRCMRVKRSGRDS
jgi:hypothetical protein